MLNRFLQQKCPNAIKQISLEELSGKSIAVDTSIYMYKYIGENALLENFYLMISFFRHYNIKPIFIFDGKPPVEKQDTIEQRKKVKKTAKEEYNRLNNILKTSNTEKGEELSQQDKLEIESTMDKLKKQFITINQENIQNVKSLFQAYGVTYFEAPGEADILCAKFVLKHKVYACLSEDMDMFVYGCPRVLRYLSLTTESVIMYDLQEILKILDITMEDFKNICILSGTDYNICTANIENNILGLDIQVCKDDKNLDKNLDKNKEKKSDKNKDKNNKNNDKNNEYNIITTIFNSYKLLKKYKELNKTSNDDFYTWLEKSKIIKIDTIELYSISTLFDLSTFKYLKNYDKIKIMNGPIMKSALIHIMEKENFIFMTN